MNLWIKFTKKDNMKYISHLDLIRLFQRIFRKCNIPIKYSQGFNPKPKMIIANPLALGIESFEEFMEIQLKEKISEEEFIETMNDDLPEGIKVLDAKYVDVKEPISYFIDWSYYEIQFNVKNINKLNLLENWIKKLLARKELIIEKEKHKGKKTIIKNKNIRPLIGNIVVSKEKSTRISDNKYLVTINCLLKSGERGNLKPTDLLKAINKYSDVNIDIDTAEIKRLKIFSEKDNKISPLM